MEKKTATATPTEFGKHPSDRLQQAFKGFQIQNPEAEVPKKIIFLGLDANWDIDIEVNEEKKDFFKETIEYLENGVEYWKKNGIHTPMLKDFYNGSGRKYHRNFKELGFSPDDAKNICFLELLKVCTYGRSTQHASEYRKMLKDPENSEHIKKIEELFKSENNFICIADGVKTKIERIIIGELGYSSDSFDFNGKNRRTHTHFSDAISAIEIKDIKKQLWEYLDKK